MSLQAVSVDKALMKAKLLTKKGNLNEAKDIYKNVLIRFPKNIRALKALQVLSKEKNNIDKQLYYVDKFIEADSILDSKSKGLISQVEKDYDLPNFEERRLKLQIALANKKYLTYAVVGLSVMLIISVTVFFLRFVKQKNRLNDAINNPVKYLKTIDSPKRTVNLNKNKLPAEHVKRFDKFFQVFEIEKQFLNHSMSLQSLASAANTNTSYLSNYLNTHKRGYSNYINRLRAQYAFTEIPKNPKLLIFTLDHIAKLYGFSSLRAFNRSFEKFLKIKPRDYLAQIKQRKHSDN